jgi:hypothetical protein
MNIDLHFDNGQIGEISLRLKEIEGVPDNHADYEYLRNATAADKQSPVYQQRLQAIRRTFDIAWNKYLARTGQSPEDIQGFLNTIKDQGG